MKTKSNGNRKKLFGKSGYKAFFAPWCGVILIALLTSSPVFGSMIRCNPYPTVLLPDLKNYELEEERGTFPTVVIDKTGKAWMLLGGCWEIIENNPKIVELLEDEVDLYGGYKSKVFLKADERVQFGKIVEVLEILSKARVKVAGLITDEKAAPIHFFKDLKKIRAAN
ncbi:ExbD/TolR family protein [Acidobacteriota bacterium]